MNTKKHDLSKYTNKLPHSKNSYSKKGLVVNNKVEGELLTTNIEIDIRKVSHEDINDVLGNTIKDGELKVANYFTFLDSMGFKKQ